MQLLQVPTTWAAGIDLPRASPEEVVGIEGGGDLSDCNAIFPGGRFANG